LDVEKLFNLFTFRLKIMSESNNDDWAMTRANFPRPKDDDFSAEEDVFARNAPPKKDDWAMTRNISAKESEYDAFDKTPPSQNNDWDKTQANVNISDWEKTQANIAIPPKPALKSNNDDWGMTQANINIPQQNSPVNLDNTMYGFSVENVSPKAKSQTYTPEIIPQKAEPVASTNDATKWIYFLAGAFSMFVFMVIFLAIIYLLFLFK
jgi:hypothetical protein